MRLQRTLDHQADQLGHDRQQREARGTAIAVAIAQEAAKRISASGAMPTFLRVSAQDTTPVSATVMVVPVSVA